MGQKIMLSHGSGGKLTKDLIESIFLKHFNYPELKELDDGTTVKLDDYEFVITTDSYVIDPPFFPGGNIGKLAVTGTVNDLAAMGAEPIFMSVAFILEEGFDLQELELIVESMQKIANTLKIKIVTGDTKVIETSRKKPSLFINTTGIGKIFKKPAGLSKIKPGDKILINGPVGEHGFAILAKRFGLDTDMNLKSDCMPLWKLTGAVLKNVDVKFMRDPTRGGLAAVLNEIVQNKNWGIKIFENKLPLSEEVKSLSEITGIDPLEVANEGKMLFVVSEEDALKTLKILKEFEEGKQAAIIGEIVKEPSGKVLLENLYGGSRFVNMPTGEQLPRIC